MKLRKFYTYNIINSAVESEKVFCNMANHFSAAY